MTDAGFDELWITIPRRKKAAKHQTSRLPSPKRAATARHMSAAPEAMRKKAGSSVSQSAARMPPARENRT